MLLAVLQHIYVFGIQAQAGIFPLEPSEKVLDQLLGILWCCGQMGIVKGQCGEQVRIREIGMQQSPQPPLCVPLIEALLNLGCRLAPLPSFLWMGIYWINDYLPLLPTIVFLLSVASLHICSLSHMVIVLIPYTSSAYGKEVHPVGKSYASIVDDEKWLLSGRTFSRENEKSLHLYHRPKARNGGAVENMELNSLTCLPQGFLPTRRNRYVTIKIFPCNVDNFLAI